MRVLLCIVVLLTAACGAHREILVAKSPAVPAGIDLSGDWHLRSTSRAIRSTDSAVDVFVESGQALKITQTDAALFISFDRSVVEEYRFGEQREVSVGPIVADRVSGWDGPGYNIETLDEKGAKLVETYRLQAGGSELLRSIVITGKRGRGLSLEQRFDRQ